MKQCFGYVRVSTQKQGEGVSLAAQKDAISAFASRHGLAVSRWFEEQETAAKSGRRVFAQMLTLLKRGHASGLIMHKIDRSARNLRDWAAIGELSDAGVDVHFATESLDFRSRGGRLTADIQAVIAADYIRNLREETKKGLSGRLKQGLYPFRAPIGYLDNGRGQVKTPCPLKAPLIRDAFHLYASGRHSLRSLHTEMTRRGLRSHVDRPVSLHGIETILHNPFYTGRILIKRTGTVYEGLHEPIIDVATFKRVQDILAGKAGKKVTKHNHAFMGLFRCGLCGGPMSPERQKGVYVYYRCHQPGCPTTTVREEAIDMAIRDRLKTLQLSDTTAAELERRWNEWLDDGDQEKIRRAFALQRAQIKERLSRAADLAVDGTLTADDYRERRLSLELELAQLNEREEELNRQHLDPEKRHGFIELMKSVARLYEIADPDVRREIIENCFSNCHVVRKDVDLEPSNWLIERDPAKLSPLVTHIGSLFEQIHLLDTEPASHRKSAKPT
ncbi:MAG: recombinase family protein [Pseudomonadota bacterium]